MNMPKKNLNEEQKTQLEALRGKQKEAFEKMMGDMVEANVTAWKLATKTLHDFEDSLDKEDKEGVETPAVVTIEEGAEGTRTFTEASVSFLKKIKEALAVGSTYTGLVPTEIASEIIKKREQFGKFRPLCRKMSFAGNYTVAVDGDQATATYVDEAGNIGDVESTPSLNLVTFSAYKLAALIKVSNEFLDDVAVDAMSWLTDNIARAFAKKEDLEILKGAGATSNNIEGILTKLNTSTDASAAAKSTLTLEEVKGLIDLLGDYKAGAVLIMHPTTKSKIKLMKDDVGQYYFPIQSDLTEVEGLKIVTSTDMAAIGDAGARVIIAANMSYYQLVDRKQMDVKVLNELFALSDQKGIVGIERVDGKVLLTDAFKVLKMGTTDPEA
jgi:HK97 family phage major capsid protein